MKNSISKPKTKLHFVNAFPKLLMFDLTAIGHKSATGQIKLNLFSEWPAGNLLCVSTAGNGLLDINGGKKHLKAMPKDVLRAIEEFSPDLIFYRPVSDSPHLHGLAMQVINQQNIPLISWIVDDWPARLQALDQEKFAEMDRDLRYLFSRSAKCYSIGEAMSAKFKDRYGCDFESLANGVDPDDWQISKPIKHKKGPFRLRYAGALSEDMTQASILRIAQAVEQLSVDHDVSMEILTNTHWWGLVRDKLSGFKSVSVDTKFRSPQSYRKWLMDADCVLLAYNFDKKSTRYINTSVANKMPECLASGAVLLAHGPKSVATISYLKKHDCAVIVTETSIEKIKSKIIDLMQDDKARAKLAEKARKLAFERHNVNFIRGGLEKTLVSIYKAQNVGEKGGQMKNNKPPLSFEFQRERAAGLDETDIVFELFQKLMDKPGTMIDVGGHFGSSAKPFAEKNWNVFAFEPDPNNRQKFIKNLGRKKNVILDSRAVGETPTKGVSFYASQESTGISGMLAFRDTHKVITTVDVTTVAEIIKEHNIDHIDFLKIDVEGYDFGVLKGVPWGKIKPDVIECEFEDAKTNLLGHTWRDICEYLTQQGYMVYVSEWHPIIRYGISHDWHAMKKYPCDLSDENAWGNLLAFKKDPGEETIADCINQVIKFRSPPKTNDKALDVKSPPKSSPAVHTPAPKLTVVEKRKTTHNELGNYPPKGVAMKANNDRFADRLRRNSPSLFRMGQIGKWGLLFLRRHIILSFLAIAALTILIAAPIFYPAMTDGKYLFWGMAGLILLGIAAFMGVSFANMMAARIIERERAARLELRDEILSLVNKGSEARYDKLEEEILDFKNENIAALKKVETRQNKFKNENKAAFKKAKARQNTLKNEILDFVTQGNKAALKKIHIRHDTLRDEVFNIVDNGNEATLKAAETRQNSLKEEILNFVNKGNEATLKDSETRQNSLKEEILNFVNKGNEATLKDSETRQNALKEEILNFVNKSNEATLKDSETRQNALKEEILNFVNKSNEATLKDSETRQNALKEALSASETKLQAQLAETDVLKKKLSSVLSELDDHKNALNKNNEKYVQELDALRQSLEKENVQIKQLAEKTAQDIAKDRKRNEASFSNATEQLEDRIDKKIGKLEGALEQAQLKLNSGVEGSAAEITSLGLAIDGLKKNMRQLGKREGNSLNAFETRFEEMASRLTNSEAQTRQSLEETVAGLRQELQETKDQLPKKRAGARPVSYHSFNRVLSSRHTNLVKQNWLKPLNLKETDKSLAYMAQRITLLESMMKGRLATSLEDAVLRTLIADSVKGRSLEVLEIGSLFGVGLAMIHDRTSEKYENVHLTAIDPLEGYYGNDAPDILTQERVSKSQFLNNMDIARIPEKDFTLLQGYSTDDKIIEQAAKRSYDLLIIDGDHSYAGVKADFINYAPMVKRGGYVIIDDDNAPEWPEITKYVDEELVPMQDNLALIGRSWRTAVFRVISKL